MLNINEEPEIVMPAGYNEYVTFRPADENPCYKCHTFGVPLASIDVQLYRRSSVYTVYLCERCMKCVRN